MRAATSCPSFLFPFFPCAFFFVPKAPFVNFSCVVVVTFKPEKVNSLMTNSIQFYYPRKVLGQIFPLYLRKLHFNTPSSTCCVIFFFSVCACIHFVSILRRCGLFTSQRTQTWCKQKSLINLTWFLAVCTQSRGCFMGFSFFFLTFLQQANLSHLSLSVFCRIIQNRILIFILGAIIVVTIILAVYFNLRGH